MKGMSTPPPFAVSSYWDDRFTKNPNAFDWLLPANTLDLPLETATHLSCRERPTVLHIGCGTSTLSFRLRSQVDDPAQIHNVDFSSQAIAIGEAKERETFSSRTGTPGEGSSRAASGPFMRWSTVDLLSLDSLLCLCGDGKYDIVVDKSTSDAIACGDDIPIQTPFHLPLSSKPPVLPLPKSQLHTSPIHPLNLLAVNLAAVTRPGSRWLALSYSSARFPFFPTAATPTNSTTPTSTGTPITDTPRTVSDLVLPPVDPVSPSDSLSPSSAEPPSPTRVELSLTATSLYPLPPNFPDPARYWSLERLDAVEAAPEGPDERGIHRPRILYWLYWLVRTDSELR